MEKIIVKTAVKAALIILGLLIAAFCVLNLAFPQHVATFTEDIGNYDLAVKYASLRYTYTGDSYDLARCVDDSILSEKDEYILEYGEKLLSCQDYAEVVEYKNTQVLNGVMDYDCFVSGKVAAAKYRQGDFDGALELAKKSNGTQSFKKGNALAALAVEVRAQRDAQSAKKLLVVLDGIDCSEEEENIFKAELYKQLNTVAVS
ncbi:MAG: hypothetical protein ACI4L9_04030 [Candidatus Coproplasma sp.]